MKRRIKSYFQIADSWDGEIYFRISKHLGIPVTDVIRRKFMPDIKFLRIKYHIQLESEKEQAERMMEQNSELNRSLNSF